MPEPVEQALSRAGIPITAVSVVVQRAAATPGVAAPIVSIHADDAVKPASLMKLMTTYAALDLLGPSYTWKTEVWITGDMAGDTLEGDLWLLGGGDPKLTLEQFWLLLRQIRAYGIREIRGDLVLDRKRFDLSDGAVQSSTLGKPVTIDGQLLRPYNTEPDALLLNFKTLQIHLVDDPHNKTIKVWTEPPLANLTVINLIKPTDEGCQNGRPILQANLGQNDRYLILSGDYPLACGSHVWRISALSHPRYIEGVFRRIWSDLGGVLHGNLRENSPVPMHARLLAHMESPMLAEIVRDINKYSNNVMARQLFLDIAAEFRELPVHPVDTEGILRSWLARQNLFFPHLVLENGSGLSRRERMTAGGLAHLLSTAWNSYLMPEFVASLPIVGVDGTMKSRLKSLEISGRARIKTGSMDDVSAIAGYVPDQAGNWWVVVFIVNYPDAAAAQGAQDELLKWIHEYGTEW